MGAGIVRALGLAGHLNAGLGLSEVGQLPWAAVVAESSVGTSPTTVDEEGSLWVRRRLATVREAPASCERPWAELVDLSFIEMGRTASLAATSRAAQTDALLLWRATRRRPSGGPGVLRMRASRRAFAYLPRPLAYGSLYSHPSGRAGEYSFSLA